MERDIFAIFRERTNRLAICGEHLSRRWLESDLTSVNALRHSHLVVFALARSCRGSRNSLAGVNEPGSIIGDIVGSVYDLGVDQDGVVRVLQPQRLRRGRHRVHHRCRRPAAARAAIGLNSPCEVSLLAQRELRRLIENLDLNWPACFAQELRERRRRKRTSAKSCSGDWPGLHGLATILLG